MDVIEGIKSNEWFHLIDHMYAKWPKIKFPFIDDIEETKGGSHLIPEIKGTTQRRQNMKRKRGRKSMQKPIKKRSIPNSKSKPKVEGRKDDPVIRAPRVTPIPVPRRISIIQTRAQKGSGSVKVGLHFRQCSCCEGSPALVKSSVPKSAKTEGEDKKQ